MTGQALIVQGDALRLPLPDRSVDAIVTDPPYGLEFMGKDWDSPAHMLGQNNDRGQSKRPRRPDGTTTNDAWRRNGAGGTHSRGYADNDPRRYQAWCQQWATDALRVLKPGGWLFAFGGTRTWHRLACGIEDAGFEMRDTIAEFGPLAWVHGQGFPKGKACLKPAWEPVIVAKRPGSSVLQIDASRIDSVVLDGERRTWSRPSPGYSKGWSSDLRIGERHNPSGRWPSNVALVHSEGCQPTGTRKIRTGMAHKQRGVSDPPLYGKGLGAYPAGTPNAGYADADGMEEITAWTCEEDCPVFLLNQQSGERPGATSNSHPRTVRGLNQGGSVPLAPGYADQGGASRFFYTAKAGPNERVTIDGEGHPTVKPLALMRWLVRLVTPPGGLILDPFAGSGTTGEAAMLEGFRAVLIDKDPANLPSIRVRTHPYVRRTRVVTNGHQTGPEQGSLLG